MTCKKKPNRTHPRVFKPRDVGRIVAYAREDGADDAELIAYILVGFGVRELGCLIYKILDILNTTVFLGSIIGLLNGVITLLKGIKLLRTLKKATIPGLLELIIPAKYLGQLGAFYVWVGAVTASASSLVVFLTAIGNNVALYLLMKGVCETDTPPYTFDIKRLDVGNLPESLASLETILREAARE